MAGAPQIPPELQDLVAVVGEVVTPEDVDAYRSVREIADKSYKIRTIVAAWEGQQREDRQLRRSYATWLLIALSVQMLIVDVAFFLLAAGIIGVDRWVAQTFIISVFGEIAAMTLIVVKYLFPETSSHVLKLIEKL